MEISDNKIIRRILGGDSNSFATLVERYNKQVYNLMYRYSGSVEESSDMTQDVFCKLFEKLDCYREQRGFFPWLYAMSLNHAKDWSRKRSQYKDKLDKFAAEPEIYKASPGDDFESKQEAKQLMKALDVLSEDRREMVILRYRHEHSIRELAEIFGLSESAVKMRLHRSLAEIGLRFQGS